MKIAIKQAFQRHFQRRFSLRLHMFVILLVTALSGVLFSKILLMFDVVNFAIRPIGGGILLSGILRLHKTLAYLHLS